ncbi:MULTISPECIES: polysaccharide deacetylase family protein [Bacillaceae]|uniref:polysaccharide deacetylase family protein n=1 Tax=Bacillaceae TaxID=186817 RepID=UPI00118808D5|nr:polysaccharide deacetylase family protein [Bacillus sp. S3]QCJ43037.1 polysaccharide deacetylase family protein [Bacillus sp. S3]
MKKVLSLFLFILLLTLGEKVSAVGNVPILVYHSIAEYTGHGSKELYVTPENFEKQIIFLRDHGYTLLTFEQWQDRNKVEKPIFITFDDGYKNNLNAFAVFQKLHTKYFKPAGTIFVISDFIGRTNRLSSVDLKRMTDSGLISIQSHTATHPDLTKSTNLTYELKYAKEKIQQITGKPVIALSYPYGNTNEKVITDTKKYYLYGLTTTPGPFSSSGVKNELYLLPRTYIKYSTTIKEFAKAVRIE